MEHLAYISMSSFRKCHGIGVDQMKNPENKKEGCEILSSGHGLAIVLMNSQELRLFAQDQSNQ